MKCFGLIIFLIFTVPTQSIAQPSLVWQEIQIPVNTLNGRVKLEALLVYPDDNAKHPLALISHGSPRNASQRPQMTALSYLPIGYEFALLPLYCAVVMALLAAAGKKDLEHVSNLITSTQLKPPLQICANPLII